MGMIIITELKIYNFKLQDKMMNTAKSLLSTLIVGLITNIGAVHAAPNDDLQLDDIVVTAKSNSKLDTIASTVNIISAQDIKESGASNLQGVLEQVAGFSYTINSSSTFGRKNIGLRGMDSQHILILIDGERTNATDGFIGHSNFQSSAINLNNVERIEVVKGAGSVLYGSEAIGGVINIITKSGAQNSYTQFSLSKGAITGRDGGDSSGLSVGAGGGKNGFYGSFNFNQDAQTAVKNSAGTGVDFEEVINRSINAAGSYNFTADTKVAISILDSNEERNLISPYYDVARNQYSLDFTTKISGWDLLLKGYKSKSDASWHAFGQSPYYTHFIENKVISAETRGTIMGNQYITLGVEQNRTSYLKDYSNPARTDYRAESTTQNAFYAQDKLTFGRNTLTGGLRFDDNSQFGSGTSGSLGFVHDLNNGMLIKASIGQAYKAPNIKEADGNYVFTHGFPGATVFQGNSNLKPETSKNAEIAFSMRGEKAKFSAALYQTKIKDMITFVNTGIPHPLTGGTELKYTNINDAKVSGLELEYGFDFSDSFFLDSSFTRMTTDDGNGGDLSFRPKFMAKVKLTKEFSHDFLLAVSANHTGSSVDGTNDVDSYTLFNAVLNKEINDSVTLKLAINNLTDEKLDDASGNHITELLGREVKLSFNLNF